MQLKEQRIRRVYGNQSINICMFIIWCTLLRQYIYRNETVCQVKTSANSHMRLCIVFVSYVILANLKRICSQRTFTREAI